MEKSGEEYGYHDFERSAASFVLEAETWPVFIEWMKKQAVSQESLKWAQSNPSPKAFRRAWLMHIRPTELRDEMLRLYDLNEGGVGDEVRRLYGKSMGRKHAE